MVSFPCIFNSSGILVLQSESEPRGWGWGLEVMGLGWGCGTGAHNQLLTGWAARERGGVALMHTAKYWRGVPLVNAKTHPFLGPNKPHPSKNETSILIYCTYGVSFANFCKKIDRKTFEYSSSGAHIWSAGLKTIRVLVLGLCLPCNWIYFNTVALICLGLDTNKHLLIRYLY